MKLLRVGLWAQAVLYVASGANHFAHKGFYVSIMPDHYNRPETWVAVSGVAEVAGGLGLLAPATRRAAAGGIALMLLGFLDVHIFMLRHAERFPGVPGWLLWARLPLQGVLVAWAWRYTRPSALD